MWSDRVDGELAQQHANDLRAAVRAARVPAGGRSGRLWSLRVRLGRRETNGDALAGLDRVTIRRSRAADRAALQRLAQLDSSRLSAGEWLVAEIEGELHAALPLQGGHPIADPFHPTIHLV